MKDSNQPRFRISSNGHVRYTANPAGVETVNKSHSASNLASRICVGLVAEIECRAKFMCKARGELGAVNSTLIALPYLEVGPSRD